ncbi:MAG: hypothetical protein RBT70_08800 [Alphaproteobacteria bacterium]|nr:hypothetical protein [Alphaproteobacteria bacterium]
MSKTRYFKVTHKAGAFIDGVHYPAADDQADVTASIVPLELAEGQNPPLWGVEVDAQGNEIGEQPAGVQDKLADALANKIAGGNAAPAAEPLPTGKDGETRKATILQSLELLDHNNDADWTSSGKPKVETVAAASGLDNLTRAEIEAAAPDFVRAAPAAE